MFLNVHGVGIAVQSHLPEVESSTGHDFHYFLREDLRTPGFRLLTRPWAQRPGWRHWLTARKFFGRTLIDYHFPTHATIYGDDPTLTYESVYLCLLSFLGESLDRQGRHRIHGWGGEWAGRGFLVLAPSGTGKSTLAIRALAEGGCKLLSDDTPLLDRQGNLWAFPQRIGLKERPAVPAEHVRTFRRVKYGEKFVVGSRYFADRIAAQVAIERVILMQRSGGAQTQLAALPRHQLILPLLKWLVIGYETPQIWQLFLRPHPADLFAKARIAVSRLRTALAIYRRAKPFSLLASEDPAECFETLQKFMSVPA